MIAHFGRIRTTNEDFIACVYCPFGTERTSNIQLLKLDHGPMLADGPNPFIVLIPKF